MLDSFLAAYIECALWSSTDDDGTPMDSRYDTSDVAAETLDSMRADCEAFCKENADDLAELSAAQSGHDFWLTRNRHGAGFWDRGLGAVGERLTASAHAYGDSDLYRGDDGKLYVS